MSTESYGLWDEVVEFLVSQPTLEEIAAYEGSLSFQERVRYLRDQNQNGLLTDNERAEMDAIGDLGRFMRHLKIRALEKLVESRLLRMNDYSRVNNRARLNNLGY